MNIKKKRILFVVGIMLLICCVFAGSYAFWTVTKEQNDTNNLVAACLDLELIEETGTFGVNNAWPISDEEGLELEGYSFKVKNNCNETVNYIIGIDSLSIEGAEYLSYDSIKVSLDSAMPEVFGSLTDVERDNGRGSKEVEIKTIEGNSTNSHNIKLWIKNEAEVSEQSKQFKGQVFITGGQGISLPSRTVLATGDISKTEEDNVNYTYYSDGELVISGTGEILDFNKLEFSLASSDWDDFFGDEYNFNTAKSYMQSDGVSLGINIVSHIIYEYIVDNYSGAATDVEKCQAWYLYSLLHSSANILVSSDDYDDKRENPITVLNTPESWYSFYDETEPVTETYIELKNLLNQIPNVFQITIESGITNVSEYFSSYLAVPVIVPDTVININNSAFKYYYYDGILSIPGPVLKIGESAFSGGTANIDINLSAITSIRDHAFRNATFTSTSISIGSNIYEIRENAFDGSNISLITINKPDSTGVSNSYNNGAATVIFQTY